MVTPERTVRETPADFVALTLFDGEIGIAPGHTPLIGRLGYGEMRIRLRRADRSILRRGRVRRGGRRRGFGVDEPRRARAAVGRPRRHGAARGGQGPPANTPELMAIRDQAVAQSRAQLRLAARAK